jgi:serine/threonine protein kinase
MSERAVKHYMIQIIQGLKEIHSKGFLYNDLKPENLLINGNGKLILHDFEHSLHLTHNFSDILSLLILHFKNQLKLDFNILKKNIKYLSNYIEMDFNNDLVLKTKHVIINLSDPQKNQLSKFANRINFKSDLKLNNIKNLRNECFGFSKTENKNEIKEIELKKNHTGNNSPNLFNYSSKIIKLDNFGGSPKYSAPEAMKYFHFSFASDFWSLGCLIFDLFNNYPLFEINSNKIEIDKKIDKIKQTLMLKHFLIEDQRFPLAAQNFMEMLLKIDPKERCTNYEEITSHPWINKFLINESNNPYTPFYSDSNSNSIFYIYNIEYQKNLNFKTNSKEIRI